VVAIIRSTGEDPTVTAYRKTGWTRPLLRAFFAAARLTRQTQPRIGDEALFDATGARPAAD